MQVQSDTELVELLDELYHQLKCSHGPLSSDFRWHLRRFLGRWGLDKDKDAYARFPEHPVWPRMIAIKCVKCGRFGPMTLRSMDDESAYYLCGCGETAQVVGGRKAFE